MAFDLKLLPKFKLPSTTDEITGERHYQTPDGVFPSVTTVLGKYYEKDLSGWKASVGGEEMAAKIAKRAADNGTILHDIMERHLYNLSYDDADSIDIMRYRAVRKHLEAHVSAVYGAEYPLWSKALKTAGKTDAIVRWKDQDTILDLKTTRNKKEEEWITNYFVQASTYAIMVNKLYKMNIKKIVILFSMNNFQSYYFEKNVADYFDEVQKVFNGDHRI